MPDYKRWYDHDPLLLEVVNLLRNYQTELKAQAEVFLAKIEEKVSKDAMIRFYEMVKPENGTRWYDKDPILKEALELLKLSTDEQKEQAKDFMLKLQEDVASDVIDRALLTALGAQDSNRLQQINNALDRIKQGKLSRCSLGRQKPPRNKRNFPCLIPPLSPELF